MVHHNCLHAFIATLLATTGVTGAAGHCTLTGGETVSNGWSGKDTGSNNCNSCSCADEGLICTEMFCLDASTEPTPKSCTLTSGKVVESGWRGHDTGSNDCNSCSCSDGMLACTKMACARRAAASETCTLTGGEVVQSGWSGKDTGSNSCNSCRCMGGGLACTRMFCGRRAAAVSAAETCTLTGGQVVQSGWKGKDTGANHCNSCSCSGEGLICTEMGCEPVASSTTETTTSAKTCKLSGGEVVPSGWSGKDTGANYCNSCTCGNGMMACTLMMCPPSTGQMTTVTTTKSVSANATCTLSDGATKVAVGWSGKDAGSNSCNSCRCSMRGLACTKKLCQRRSTTTAAGRACTLTGGEVVLSGWSGKDTGSNHCNSCSCSDGNLECTEMGCAPLDDSLASTTATTTPAKTCKLTGGEVVPSGWAGKDTGDNYCNSCRCGNGMMACTRMLCPPTTAEPVAVTTTKAGSVRAMCTLSDGATKVADGWSGKDAGANSCNSCRCSNGTLACTRMLCQRRSTTTAAAGRTCTLTGGEVVQSGWSGKDTGSNNCNSCGCSDGSLECDEEACAAVSATATTTTAKMCKLTGGELVPSGWAGKDTGDNYCNSCRCGNGMMACTLMLCPPESTAQMTTATTTKAASLKAMCTLGDGITKVAAGWSGKDLGRNWCNSCSCTEGGALMCTMMFCMDDLQVVQV